MRATPLTAAAALLLSSCSLLLDTDELAEPGATREEVEAFAGSFHDAYVAAYAATWVTTPALARIRTALNDRSTYVARAWELAQRGNRRYDTALRAQCLRDVAAAPDAAALLLAATGPASACQRAGVGTLAQGEPCAWDKECAGDSYCANPLYACPGSCAPRRPAGSACSLDEGYAECAAGLRCTGGTCVEAFQGEGQSCAGSPPPSCLPGLRCVGGLCAATLTLNEGPCDFNTDCQPGLYCDSADTLCKSVHRLGEDCTAGSCQPGARCAEGGSCVALPVDGQACGMLDAGDYTYCLVGNCDGANCVRVRREGESCSGADFCEYSGTCNPGRGFCFTHCP